MIPSSRSWEEYQRNSTRPRLEERSDVTVEPVEFVYRLVPILPRYHLPDDDIERMANVLDRVVFGPGVTFRRAVLGFNG